MVDSGGIEELLKQNGRGLLEKVKSDRHRGEVIGRLWEAAQAKNVDKSVQKSVKRALYALRSSGIDVDRYRPVREGRKKEAEEKLTIDTALLSIPDGPGYNQLVIAVLNENTSALTLYRFVIHAGRGVLQLSAARGSRKVLKKLEDDPFFSSVPPEYALYRLSEALEKTDRKKVSGSDALPAILQVKQPRVEHPVVALAGARLTRIVKPAEERELFSLGEIGGMTLPEEDIGAFREQVNAARESRLVIQNRTPEERVREVMERFYRSYFTPERLADLSTRLLDTALAFHHRGMHEYTKLLLEYAEHLTSPGLAKERHPLLNYLTYKAFMNR